MIETKLAIIDPVVDWAIEHPGTNSIFEKYGIDYCCAGKSLAYACERRGVNPQQLLQEFTESIAAETASQ